MELLKRILHTFVVFLFFRYSKVLAFHSRGSSTIRTSNSRRIALDDNPIEIPLQQEGDENPTAQTADPSCPKCLLRREQIKQLRIEQVKQNILSYLKLPSIPNATLDNVPHIAEVKRIMDDFSNGRSGMQNDEPVYRSPEDKSSTIEKIILFPKRPIQDWGSTEPTFFSFQFDDRLFEYDVKEALLRVHLRRANVPGSAHFIVVNRIFPRTDATRKPKIKFSLDKKVTLDPDRGQWAVINVTSIAQEWIQAPRDSHLLQIQLVDDENNPMNSHIDTEVDMRYPKRPYIIMSLRKKNQRRVRRDVNTNQCTEDMPRETCCMYPLTIDFEAIAWDWVLVPRRFEANYCDGSCPLQYANQYSHTFLAQTMMQLKIAGTGPCCSPKEMQELNLLYFDTNDNIQLNSVPDMAVLACGCS